MKSTITLYKGTGLTPEKNFALATNVLNQIETYLATFENTTNIKVFSLQNYVKHDLYIEVKLPLNQEALDGQAGAWNYCKIENTKEGVSETPAYYYITKMQWVSIETVRLYLTMDTVNTIGANIELTAKTFVRREHRDRWKRTGSYFYGKIDDTPEGVAPRQFKTNETVLTTNDYNAFKWYMVYVNNDAISESAYNQVNPIKCLIAPAHTISINMAGEGYSLSLYYDNETYLISPIFNNTNKMGRINAYDGTDHFMDVSVNDISEVDPVSINLTTYPTTKTIVNYVKIERSGSTYTCTPYNRLYNASGTLLHEYIGTPVTANTVKLYNFPGKIVSIRGGSTDPYASTNHYTQYASIAQITGIDELDKTLDVLIKIVELPYCPIKFTQVSYYYIFDLPVDTESDSGNHFTFIKVKGANLNYYENELSIPVSAFSELTSNLRYSGTSFLKSQVQDNKYEPKQYSSEFFTKKFVYDSFEYIFNYDGADISANASTVGNKVPFKQVTSLAISSKFLFDLTRTWTPNRKSENYSAVLPISRNNEIVIYTNQYLNYLRNQRDYDLKLNEALKQQSIINAIVGGVSYASSQAASMQEDSNIINAGVQTAAKGVQIGFVMDSLGRQADAQAQKERLLLRQKTSVQGSDDLSLLNYYTNGNFPKIVTYKTQGYEPVSIIRSFHFKGYNTMAFEIPSIYTRIRFNYIEADIAMKEETSAFIKRNYSEDVLNNYIARWANGLTILHIFEDSIDFNQIYENWEKSIESYLQ